MSELRVECITHGDVAGVRDDRGRLGCAECAAARQAQATATAEASARKDEMARKEQARKLVDRIFDPERMAAHRRQREEKFKECLVDAFAEQARRKGQS